MKKRTLLILLFVFFLSLFSCTYKKELKITVFDTKGNPIPYVKVDVLSYTWTETGDDGSVRIKLEPKEYILKVSKPGFFSVKRRIDLNKENELNFTLLSFREGMSRIVEAINDDLKDKKHFKVYTRGTFPTGSVNFTSEFFLDEAKIVVKSDELTQDVLIDYKDGEFKYNGNSFPEEERGYLPKLIDLINDSIIFLKDYPLNLTLKYGGSSLYFSNITFKEDKGDYKIFGFFTIDNESLKVKKEYIDFFAVDRLNRKTHYTIIFFYDE